MPDNPGTIEEWLPCLTLPEYAARVPCGHIAPICGPEIWIDGTGVQYSKEAYIKKWGVDPSVAWKAVKEYRKRAGKKDNMMML